MLKIALSKIISNSLRNRIISHEIKEQDVDEILKEVRISLLNSDVNLTVVKNFLNDIKQELLEKKSIDFNEKLDVVIFSTIKKKLINILGSQESNLNLSKDLNKILLVGINGSGKTTTTGKISYFLKNKKNLIIKNISLDIYRPAAFNQLKKNSDLVGIPSFFVGDENIRDFIKNMIDTSAQDNTNVLLFDSFGLLKDNQKLVEEIELIKKIINPNETLFVLDAMSGQEILEVIKFFHEKLKITGLIISKSDSNAPMGAAFSASYLLGIPIKFLGEGEHLQDLKIFYPERIASLILGEGDILTLAEKISDNSDAIDSQKNLLRFINGKFDLDDLIIQIKNIKKIGSLSSVFKFLPNVSNLNMPLDQVERLLKIWETLISSMTVKERKNPKLFKKESSRKIRVVKGSGKKMDDLNKLLKKWENSKTKMLEVSKRFKKTKNLFNAFF